MKYDQQMSLGLRLPSFLFMEGVQNENQSAPPQSNSGSSASQNPIFKEISFWGGIIVIIGFFLPWVEISFFIAKGSISGFKLVMDGATLFNATRFVLLLMPLVAALCVYQWYSKNIILNIPYLKFVPLIALAIFTLANLSGGSPVKEVGDNNMLNQMMGNMMQQVKKGIFDMATIGFYISAVGAIAMCLNMKLGEKK